MQNAKSIWLFFFLACLLAGCNSDTIGHQNTQSGLAPSQTVNAEHIASLAKASCTDPSAFITPQSIELSVTPLVPDGLDGATLNGLTFAGAWHLTSDEPNFGGLSGLAVHPKDHLLAVSDAGAFIWISMLDHVPSGFAAISFMRDEAGAQLDGKDDADAEGLALMDGMAFVGFERNHRVVAFDLANCGAAAKGVPVAKIPTRVDGIGRDIPSNEGAEALAFTANGTLLAGLEMKSRDQAAILNVTDKHVQFEAFLPRPSDQRLVGLDQHGDTLFALFRSYSPLTGNRNTIQSFRSGHPEAEPLVQIKRPFPVDNFEGITVTRLPDGTVRLYIISDDNFSGRQRTLLMAFDLLPAN